MMLCPHCKSKELYIMRDYETMLKSDNKARWFRIIECHCKDCDKASLVKLRINLQGYDLSEVDADNLVHEYEVQ